MNARRAFLGCAVSLLVPIAIATVPACAPTTSLKAVWKDPGAAPMKFKKIIVVAQSSAESTRRTIETHIAQRVANATASYAVITEAEARNPDAAKAKIAAAGYDGAIVVRFAKVDKSTTYVPGTSWWGPAPYGSMWGGWGYGWGMAYDPGYIQRDTIVSLESNVYSLAQDKLLWASRSETMNPDSVEALVKSVVDATVKEMKKQKVL